MQRRASSVRLNLNGKTVEDLLEMKLQLEEDISSIRSQIQRAQTVARETGVYADSEWWSRINRALRIKGKQCQQIQNEISRLKRKHHQTVETHFVNVAREQLHQDTFHSLLETAKQRALAFR